MLSPIIERAQEPSAGSGAGGAGGSSPVDGGNGQSPDAGDAGLDAGAPQIDSGLDPSIVFEWTETLPGPGTCGAGAFVGSFSCTIEGRPAAPIVGQVTMDVAASGAGETTLLVTGKLTDPTGTDLFFSATIDGALDCTQNTLDAITQDGRAAGFFGESGFETAMAGTYDPETLEILGTVTMVNEASEVCRGSFQVGSAL